MEENIEQLNKSEIVPPIQKQKKFKEYYDGNPEFREKHKDYVRQKINCPDCNKPVARSNLSAHRRTKKHAKLVNKYNEERMKNDNEQRLLKEIEELKKKLNSIKIEKENN